MKTLHEIIIEPYAHQCRKHWLNRDVDEYVEQQINRMTNMELLREISDALDDILTKGNP